MASKLPRIQSNFNKGILSPFIEGRPDLAAYFNGASRMENFYILPEGGVTRRPGTVFVAETKYPDKKSIQITFEYNVEQVYILEVGYLYIRVYKAGVLQTELVSPYMDTDLPELQWRQSADVLFIVHPTYQQRKLNRVSDTNWSLTLFNANPPPSYEADTDISGGSATLTPSATSGNGVPFTASAGVFLAGDINRQIIFGASRAVITAVDVGLAIVTVNILDGFPNTSAIPAGSWFLRGSPQVTLDPDKKEPVGAQVALSFGGGTTAALRPADVGKYIRIYGGLVKIAAYTSGIAGEGTILSIMSDVTAADPAAAPAGSWSIEVPSWSDARGWPRSLEFHEGRLYFAGTDAEPTTMWGSASDDFENFAVGSLANNAVNYAIAARQANILRWMVSMGSLFLGDAKSEHKAKGQGQDTPLGGDEIPFMQNQSNAGSAPHQPVVVGQDILFIGRALKHVYAMAYDLARDSFTPKILTRLSRLITGSGLLQHPPVYAQDPNSLVYFLRTDGKAACLTYDRDEEVTGWSLLDTDGEIESIAILPQPDENDQVWITVKRTINGATKRFIEYFEDNSTTLANRKWKEIYTDCAVVAVVGSPSNVITGLGHLEGKDVDAVVNQGLGNVQGSYKGRHPVIGGQVTLPETLETGTQYEVGLPYISTLKTMRPAIPEAMIEGIPRQWKTAALRLYKTLGGKINGDDMIYTAGSSLDQGLRLFTGDKQIDVEGNDTDGYITITQDQPYPMTITSLFGELTLGEHIDIPNHDSVNQEAG